MVQISFAEIVSTQIKVNILGNSSVNISSSDSGYVYNGSYNSNNSFILNIEKNITYVDYQNITTQLSSVTSMCDNVLKQYNDLNQYYKLYTECIVVEAICQKEKQDKDINITDLAPYRGKYDTCNGNLNQANTNLEGLNLRIQQLNANVTNLSSDLSNAKSNQWLYGVIGAILIGIVWIIDRNKLVPKTSLGKISR